MSLYYVMRPDNAYNTDAVFTRFGGLTQNLLAASKRAHTHCGRVFETNGSETKLVEDHFDPKPVQLRPLGRREYWAQRNQAAIFS